MSFGIGQPVTRVEDPRFLTGRGEYVDDIVLPNMAHVCVVYSDHAHADIKSIDTSAAQGAPGVLAVLTGDDTATDGLGGLVPDIMPEALGGPPGFATEMPILARDRVRFVGERVVAVVAETEAQARDAAELVKIEYAPLPAVVMTTDAVKDDAPQIWGENAPNNTSFTFQVGQSDDVEAAFAKADHVTTVDVYNNRLSPNSMETRISIGDYDPGRDRYTLYTSSQNPHGHRHVLGLHVFHEPEHKFRVVSPDVGGGFGLKGSPFPEDAIVIWAAKRVGRPVKWVPTRSEAMLGDHSGRDITFSGGLALDKDGKILAMRWHALGNVGPYIVGPMAVILMFAVRMGQTNYDIPLIDASCAAVFTNTGMMNPYRGAGRPEAIYIVERLLDKAAREMNIDPAEIRRRNFIKADAMPFTTLTHHVYDSGDFEAAQDDCLKLADWDGFEARKKESEAKGRLRGRGLIYYIDAVGIFNERMEIHFNPSGTATIIAGTLSHGQGHETAYRQMLNDFLGLPFEQIDFIQGDTDKVMIGRGTYGSRSMLSGGHALRVAADRIIEKGKQFAGIALEASASDIEFADGMFTVKGTDKAMPLKAVAEFSYIPMMIPDELGVGLEAAGTYDGAVGAYPNGCHICEVEIDPDTGKVWLDKHTVIDDIGNVMNPLLATGQIHGGVAQGVGQALMEDMKYDPESGQLLTGSFLDYCMPRADDLPHIECGFHPVPCPSNRVGAKGVGEGGTIGATPAVINAIVDALAPYGVDDLPLPATPEVVWRAISNGSAKAA